mmetsp:Transcript_54563/g.127047  ORF Transcript_54563/g.127047 Transcript_54563/m.127047 type:complete len:230 (+) Transcript_54563:315-1004(+)
MHQKPSSLRWSLSSSSSSPMTNVSGPATAPGSATEPMICGGIPESSTSFNCTCLCSRARHQWQSTQTHAASTSKPPRVATAMRRASCSTQAQISRPVCCRGIAGVTLPPWKAAAKTMGTKGSDVVGPGGVTLPAPAGLLGSVPDVVEGVVEKVERMVGVTVVSAARLVVSTARLVVLSLVVDVLSTVVVVATGREAGGRLAWCFGRCRNSGQFAGAMPTRFARRSKMIS